MWAFGEADGTCESGLFSQHMRRGKLTRSFGLVKPEAGESLSTSASAAVPSAVRWHGATLVLALLLGGPLLVLPLGPCSFRLLRLLQWAAVATAVALIVPASASSAHAALGIAALVLLFVWTLVARSGEQSRTTAALASLTTLAGFASLLAALPSTFSIVHGAALVWLSALLGAVAFAAVHSRWFGTLSYSKLDSVEMGVRPGTAEETTASPSPSNLPQPDSAAADDEDDDDEGASLVYDDSFIPTLQPPRAAAETASAAAPAAIADPVKAGGAPRLGLVVRALEVCCAALVGATAVVLASLLVANYAPANAPATTLANCAGCTVWDHRVREYVVPLDKDTHYTCHTWEMPADKVCVCV